jgi:hypothetical protein
MTLDGPDGIVMTWRILWYYHGDGTLSPKLDVVQEDPSISWDGNLAIVEEYYNLGATILHNGAMVQSLRPSRAWEVRLRGRKIEPRELDEVKMSDPMIRFRLGGEQPYLTCGVVVWYPRTTRVVVIDPE